MKRGKIITIDGPSGAGKGTVARALAKRLGLIYLDTGAMYRAVALHANRKGTDLNNEKELTNLLFDVHISLQSDSNSDLRVILNEEDITEEIRTSEISRLSSYIATKKIVRDVLKRMQKRIGKGGNIVAEGRDMGTYVFPDADFKFYLDATPDERARRRWLQLKDVGIDEGMDKVRAEMEERDKQDMERSEAPLHPALNAVIIDTTNLTVEEVVDKIIIKLEVSKEHDG
jgi:cytidylate kinase